MSALVRLAVAERRRSIIRRREHRAASREEQRNNRGRVAVQAGLRALGCQIEVDAARVQGSAAFAIDRRSAVHIRTVDEHT